MASREDLKTLLQRAREQDSEAWGRIYEAYAPSVFRLCRRVLPTRQDAEDATGEIFLKAGLRLSQYDLERPFEPWLYRVAANHCWDELRKKKSRHEFDDMDEELAKLQDDAPTPQEAVLVKENKRAVRKVIAQLDDRSRMAIALRYFADLSYEEIAETLGVSSNYVGVLLLRARRDLRQRLGP